MVKRGRGFRHSRICFLLFNTLSGMGGLDETCISWRRFYSRTDLVVFLLLGMGGLLFNLEGIFASEKSKSESSWGRSLHVRIRPCVLCFLECLLGALVECILQEMI